MSTPELTINGKRRNQHFRHPESGSRISKIPLTPPSAPPFGNYNEAAQYPRPLTRDPTPSPSQLMSHQKQRSDETTSRLEETRSPYALNPYLGLPTRLSLTILSLPLISLLLTIPTLLTASSSARRVATLAKSELQARCAGANDALNWLQNGGLTRIVAEKVNEETLKSVQVVLDGSKWVLVTSLTIMEKVLAFFVDTYRSLLMCTIELVVRGTLSILIGAVQTISSAVTSSLNGIRSEIQDEVAVANSLVQSAVSGANKIANLVNVNITIPEFSIPALTSLENVTIPTGFQDDLIKLNASIPSLDELRDTINHVLATPFESLKSSLNNSFTNLTAQINTTVLPVPVQSSPYQAYISSNQNSSDICSGIDSSFLDDIANDIEKLSKIAIALIVLGFLGFWILLLGWEWKRFARRQELAKMIATELSCGTLKKDTLSGLKILHIVEHPFIETHYPRVMAAISRDKTRQGNLRWFLSTITHGPALALLLFASLSFVAIQAQITAMEHLKEKSTASASLAIDAQAGQIASNLNAAMLDQSKQYAQDVNEVISSWQKTIDSEVFGPWVNTTTVGLNETIVHFYSEVENVLNLTFGGTVLAAPINNFVFCILGSKVEAVENALTWIHENARVTLPMMDESALVLTQSTMANLTHPLAQAMSGSSTDSNGEAEDGYVGRIFAAYEDSLRKQRLVSGLLLAAYAVVVVIAFIIMASHLWIKPVVQQRKDNRKSISIGTAPAYANVEDDAAEANKTEKQDPWAAPGSPWIYALHASRSDAPSPIPTDPATEAEAAAPANADVSINRWSARLASRVPKFHMPRALNRNNSKRSERSWLAKPWSPYWPATDTHTHLTEPEMQQIRGDSSRYPIPAIWNTQNSEHGRGRSITQPFMDAESSQDPFTIPFDDTYHRQSIDTGREARA